MLAADAAAAKNADGAAAPAKAANPAADGPLTLKFLNYALETFWPRIFLPSNTKKKIVELLFLFLFKLANERQLTN